MCDTCTCKTSHGMKVVCDPCAVKMVEALFGLSPKQDPRFIEKPTVLTSAEYRGMKSAVNGWLDELEVAKR